MFRAIIRPIVFWVYYLRMTGFPFMGVGIALLLAAVAGYFLRGML